MLGYTFKIKLAESTNYNILLVADIVKLSQLGLVLALFNETQCFGDANLQGNSTWGKKDHNLDYHIVTGLK